MEAPISDELSLPTKIYYGVLYSLILTPLFVPFLIGVAFRFFLGYLGALIIALFMNWLVLSSFNPQLKNWLKLVWMSTAYCLILTGIVLGSYVLDEIANPPEAMLISAKLVLIFAIALIIIYALINSALGFLVLRKKKG